MGRLGRRLAAGVGIALIAAGCGGSVAESPPADQAPAAGSGYFVGSSAGVGAAVDVRGRDPVARAVRRVLGPRRVVAVVALINERDSALRTPRFWAALDDATLRPLPPASDALAGTPGAAARRAMRLAESPQRVPARAARTIYLALPVGLPLGRLASVNMRVPGEEMITLRERAR